MPHNVAAERRIVSLREGVRRYRRQRQCHERGVFLYPNIQYGRKHRLLLRDSRHAGRGHARHDRRQRRPRRRRARTSTPASAATGTIRCRTRVVTDSSSRSCRTTACSPSGSFSIRPAPHRAGSTMLGNYDLEQQHDDASGVSPARPGRRVPAALRLEHAERGALGLSAIHLHRLQQRHGAVEVERHVTRSRLCRRYVPDPASGPLFPGRLCP